MDQLDDSEESFCVISEMDTVNQHCKRVNHRQQKGSNKLGIFKEPIAGVEP